MAICSQKVDKSFKGIPLLSDVNFCVGGGEFAWLRGSNGGGKTTLLRMCVGVVSPTSGTFQIFDTSPRTFAGQITFHGVIPTGLRLGARAEAFFHNECRRRGVDRTRANQLWGEAGLDVARRTKVGSLSNGQKQRLALAVTFASHSDILLLDEPDAGLDVDGVEWLSQLLTTSLAVGTTVIMASHSDPRSMGLNPETVLTIRAGKCAQVAYRDLDHAAHESE